MYGVAQYAEVQEALQSVEQVDMNRYFLARYSPPWSVLYIVLVLCLQLMPIVSRGDHEVEKNQASENPKR